MDEINFYFRKKETGWLSNFWRAKQVVRGYYYPTNEHFYQAMKANDNNIIQWISEAPNPFLAMKAGRSLRKGKEFIKNWDNLKVNIMYEGLLAKFSQNTNLKEKLLATEDAILHEDSPSDMFWGKKGKDMLGKLIMKVRGVLRDNEK